MRFIIGILVAIGLVVLVVILLLSGGGGTPQKQTFLPDYASTDSSAQYTIKGPVSAPQNHYEVQITVTDSTSTIQVLQGYEDHVVREKSYAMSNAAYTEFLYALQRAGYTKGDTSKSHQDSRGYCPLGDRYIFQFNDGTNEIVHFWDSSCGSKTFSGDLGTVRRLFENEIPDYGNISSAATL